MFSIASHTMKENMVLVFDIQSGVINGALALLKPDKSFKVQNIKNKQIIRRGHMETGEYIKSMMSSLVSLGHELAESHHISQVHIILSSPWIISQSKTTKVQFDKDTLINSKLIDGIVEEGSDKNTFDDDAVYIEKKIFDIKLNGYSVTKYIDRTAKKIEVSFASTITSGSLINNIRDTIKKQFGVNKIDYHSSLLMNFISLRKLVTDMNDYVYMHIHAELTDIIVVRNGICSHIASFPVGLSSLKKRLAQALNIDEKMVDSTLSVYKDGKFDENEKAKVKSKLDEYSSEWSNNYLAVINECENKDLIPEVMYISAVSNSDIYKDIIKSKVSGNIHFVDLDVDTMVVHTLALSDVV